MSPSPRPSGSGYPSSGDSPTASAPPGGGPPTQRAARPRLGHSSLVLCPISRDPDPSLTTVVRCRTISKYCEIAVPGPEGPAVGGNEGPGMNTNNAHPAPQETSRAQLNSDRARRIAEESASTSRIPGMSFAVASPEGILCAGAIGYADLAEGRGSTVNDQYPWFSMTKIATATAAVRLHADGQLDLDAPIGTYLPDYRPTQARPPHDTAIAHPHRRAGQPAADPLGPVRGSARGPGAARAGRRQARDRPRGPWEIAPRTRTSGTSSRARSSPPSRVARSRTVSATPCCSHSA